MQLRLSMTAVVLKHCKSLAFDLRVVVQGGSTLEVKGFRQVSGGVSGIQRCRRMLIKSVAF